ncbi:hypothetical protein BN136_3258 [Cronobacter universalis NCTC 9529]|nr:hypothetical protein BN136_3258 [Cronobacter universalis NCTC 9529]
MTTTDFIVVEVVRRGDFHAASAFFHIGVFVADDRDAAVNQRQHDILADQIFITRIFRVYGNAGIAQQGFRAGGGDHQVIFAVGGFRAVRQRIADMPHRAFRLAVFHFQVRDSGTQFRVPVYETLAAIDQIFFIKTDEHLFHRVGEAFIHGEALALPVHRVTQTTHLARNGAAGFRFPLPDFLDEGVAAVVVTGFTFFSGDFTLDDHLGRDTGVVGADLPQGVFTLHTLVADHGVHDGLLEGVTHMQTAGDVRRRDHDAEAFLALVAVGFEIALLLPVLVKRLFDILGVICLFHFYCVVPGAVKVAVVKWKPAAR